MATIREPSTNSLRYVFRHAKPRRSSRGFTLLETIMVLMLLAVLTLLIASAFGVTRRADVRTTQWNHALERMDAAQSYLRRALMSARPTPLFTGVSTLGAHSASIDAVGNRKTVFTGDDTHMSFLAPAPMVQESSGPKYNDLRIVRIHAQQWLVLQLSTMAPDGTLQAWGDQQILAGPLRDGNFTYKGIDAQGKPTAWLTAWPWPRRLPRIVRIQLNETQSNKSQGPIWQTMTIPLLLQSVDQQGGGT